MTVWNNITGSLSVKVTFLLDSFDVTSQVSVMNDVKPSFSVNQLHKAVIYNARFWLYFISHFCSLWRRPVGNFRPGGEMISVWQSVTQSWSNAVKMIIKKTKKKVLHLKETSDFFLCMLVFLAWLCWNPSMISVYLHLSFFQNGFGCLYFESPGPPFSQRKFRSWKLCVFKQSVSVLEIYNY